MDLTWLVTICYNSAMQTLNGNWWVYEYVCPNCDASMEYTMDISEVSPIYMINITCPCGGKAVKVSEYDAIIGAL